MAGLPDAPFVLDGGCGSGRMSRYLADRGCRVEGIDLSPAMVEMARRDHADIRTRVASLTALPFDGESFDGLFYWYSVIDVPDVDLPSLLLEARRVLRPGGSLLVAFQTGRGTRVVGKGYRRLGLEVTMNRYHRTPGQLSAVMAEHGFVERARMVRLAMLAESDGQAVLLAGTVGAEPPVAAAPPGPESAR